MEPLTDRQIRNKECSIKSDIYKKELKKNRTPAENHLWKLLIRYKKENRVKFVYRPKFKFQKAFWKGNAFVIVDFFFPATNSCIEVDGGYHYTAKGIAKDKWRDAYLNSRGVKVVHVTNEIVLKWDLQALTNFLHDNHILGRGFKQERNCEKVKYFK
jgi:very-short-patch-repair endonuclease